MTRIGTIAIIVGSAHHNGITVTAHTDATDSISRSLTHQISALLNPGTTIPVVDPHLPCCALGAKVCY